MEPWLSGTMRDLDPLRAAVCYSYAQVREEVRQWSAGLTEEQMWARPLGLAPAGFHLRHIAGSVDRLTTYLRGELLSEEQMGALRAEGEEGGGVEELVRGVEEALAASEAVVRGVDPGTYGEFRGVGRKQLPTTVGGLMVHLAEHTQRHLGQFVVTVKAVRAS